MRNTRWIIALLLIGSIGLSTALAADAAQPASAAAPAKLETISGEPADKNIAHQDCPMHHDKEKCDHKNGEPCPYHDKGHHDNRHHGHSHEKCEHEHSRQ